MAGQTERTWAAIVKAPLRRPKLEDGMVCLEEIDQHNARVQVVIGFRTENMPGLQHDKKREKLRRVEET